MREELGVVGEIIGEWPGWWLGSMTATRLFLVRTLGPLGAHDCETASVRWATVHEARDLIGLSSDQTVRARDLAVLDAVAAAPLMPG